MAARFCLWILISFSPAAFADEFIVWDVGQGQWTTLISQNICWHFDTGGEHAPWPALMRACRARHNVITYSHWDWDHLSFAAKLGRYLPDNCLLKGPVGEGSPHKVQALARLKTCTDRAPYVDWVDESGPSSNDKSRVVLLRQILIPGDSTSREEKFWVHAFRSLPYTRLLVLGHHGSRTSTSKLLMDHLPHLLAAVSSARRAKYGHPHAQVEKLLRLARVPLLRTEEWGSLHFEL